MTMTLTQAATICANGVLCTNQGTMPLSQCHHCLLCAFATHVVCAKEVEEMKSRSKPTDIAKMLCIECLKCLEIQGNLVLVYSTGVSELEFSMLDEQAMMESESIKLKATAVARNVDVDMVTIDLQDQVMAEEVEINPVDTAPTKKDSPTKSPMIAKNGKEEVFKGYQNL